MHANKWRIDSGVNRGYLFQRQIETGFLSMSVSAKTVKRAIGILEQVIRELFKAGFSLTVEGDGHRSPASAVLYEGEVFPFRIKEIQVSKLEKNDWHPSHVLVPTGRLVLELYTGFSNTHPSKLFSDTEYTKLEDKVQEIVPYLKRAVQESKRKSEQAVALYRQQEEELRRKREHEQAIKQRSERLRSILRDIRLYNRAQIIRNYCDKVEPLVSSSDYLEKIEIARRFADWIDVTVDYTDELSEKYHESDFLE